MRKPEFINSLTLLSSLSACLIGGSSALLPSVSLAQASQAQTTETIEEIIVLNQRRAYRGDFALLETPQAIEVLSSQLLDQAGVTDLTEALDLSAAVARQNNFGGLWNSFAVRGFAGDENLPSNYLVNGFNAGRGFGGSRDISGIDSVEILKGPTAALFGRGEPGGAVNLVTKKPTGIQAAQLRLGADEFGSRRVDVDANSALIADRAGVRFVGFYDDGDSFRDTVRSKAYGMSPSIAVSLSERSSLSYELEASHKEVPFDRGVVAVNGQLGLVPPERFLGEPSDGPMTAEVLGHQIELSHELADDWSLLLGMNYRGTSLSGFSTEPELTASRQRLNRDGRTLTRQRRHRDYDAEYLVLRAETSGTFATGNLTHRVLIGADTDRFENDQIFMRYRAPVLGPNTTLQQSYAIDIYQPVYGRFPPPALSPLTDRVDVLEATGLYVQDQINLTQSLQLRLGLRFDDFTQRSRNRLANSVIRQSDTRVSPQAGLVYSIAEHYSVYASYGEGFRANPGADFAGNAFDPNESRSSELGFKFEIPAQNISGNLAVYELRQRNMLSADAVNAGFSVAVGEARSRGFEVDITGTFEQFNYSVSYAWTDAEATRGVLDTNFGLQIRDGDRLLNVPEQSLSVQAAHDFSVQGRALTVGAGALYVGERLGEVASSFSLPSYTLGRIFVSYNIRDNVQLRAEIDNVFDREHYTNSFSQLWLQPGTPRRSRLSAQVNF